MNVTRPQATPLAPERSLRIAMLYTPLVTAGGAERQFLEEARSLRAMGHHVTALTFRFAPDALFERALCDDVTVLPARRGWLGQLRALRAVLRRMRPDVLVSHTSPELTWLTMRGAGVPYVQYHNSPPFYIGAAANPYMASRRYRRVFPRVRDGAAGYAEFAAPPAIGWWQRIAAELRTALKHRALRDARAVVVPSKRTVRELRLLHGVEATVVRGCLPEALLECASEPRDSAQPDGKVVLSVCRLEAVKRVDLLLRAFALVLQSLPDTTLVVAGTGAEAGALAELAGELGLGASVRFTGYVPEAQLAALLERAAVFAAPAMADFNIAPYEALARGCNVVWTTEMETDAAIEASGRVFVAPPETAAFARALIDALTGPRREPPDLAAMTWEARASRLGDLYRSISGRAAA